MSIKRMIAKANSKVAAAVVAAGLVIAPLSVAAAGPASALPCSGVDCGGGSGGGGGVPALVRETYNNLDHGIHMDTTARVSRNTGTVDGEPTHTWTDWWGVGGHGSVAVELLNSYGDVIGVTNPQTYGVDAKSIFWGRSSRFDYWSQTFSPMVTQATADIKILHTTAERDNFMADLRQIRDKACAVWQLVAKTCPLGPVS